MRDYGAEAKNRFLAGYNCAQSVFCTFAADCGLTEDAAMRMASSFGGGMGRLREVCGAVSGILLAAGILYGYDTPGDDTRKAAHYKLVQELAEAFRAQHGTIICRELLGRGPGKESYVPEARTQAYYAARPCPELVATAAEIFGRYLEENPPERDESGTSSERQAARNCASTRSNGKNEKSGAVTISGAASKSGAPVSARNSQ